jgi:hypothetical protein
MGWWTTSPEIRALKAEMKALKVSVPGLIRDIVSRRGARQITFEQQIAEVDAIAARERQLWLSIEALKAKRIAAA